jgi:primosomal protein N'
MILGPADAAISKIKTLYRKHIVIKDLKTADPSGQLMRHALSNAQALYNATSKKGGPAVRVVIDIDPEGMM